MKQNLSIASKTEPKTVILFTPSSLVKARPFFSFLTITKSGNTPVLKESDFSREGIEKFFREKPLPLRAILENFTPKGLERINQLAENKASLAKAGKTKRNLITRFRSRSIQDLFHGLYIYLDELSFYHTIRVDTNRFKTVPCRFSPARPKLRFSASCEKGIFKLDTFCIIDNTEYPISDLNRFEFLLEKDGTWFLLNSMDYLTLWKLDQAEIEKYSDNQRDFQENILALIEKDYRVERNYQSARNEIRCVPRNQVYFSEISNSFLMITPQWDYDGFTAEGNYTGYYDVFANGKEYRIIRDSETEQSFISRLRSLHPNFAKQNNGYFYLSFADAQKKQWFLKVFNSFLDEDIIIKGMDMLKHFRYSPEKMDVSVTDIQSDNERIRLKMEISFGKENIPVSEIQKVILNGQRAIVLKDSSLGILPEEFFRTYGQILRHGKIKGSQVDVPRWLGFSEQATEEREQVLHGTVTQSWWNKWISWQQTDNPVFEKQPYINATLRPYQQKGFEWMVLLGQAGAGGMLADDMGLGKTLQTICFLAERTAVQPTARHLVVCASSLMYNWQSEIRRFAPKLNCKMYYGTSRKIEEISEEDVQILITSYQTARNDIQLLAGIEFDAIIFDESHHVKNPDALTTRAMYSLKAATRFVLSGTPVMNNTFDLYAQIQLVLPGIFGSTEFFKREYADPIDRYRNEEKVESLKKLTSPFILRRTKEQVATDLPDKSEMVLYCTMTPAQQELYDRLKSAISSSLFLNIRNNGLGKAKMAVLQGMLRLRQVCNSPLLLPEEEQTCSDSVKTEVLIQELKNTISNRKVLVFSQFSTMLNLLAQRLKKEGIDFYHFDGSTPPEKRNVMVTAFQQEDDKTPVFLISLKAGNAGLNLTAADYVFLFDPWWNEAVQQQAIDRTHRIGQTKNIFAYKMICRDTIEEKILALQQSKKKLSEELISADEGFVKSLTEEDITWLFA